MDHKEELNQLNINHTLYRTRLNRKFLGRKPFRKTDPGIVSSFIPGTILDIFVSEGQEIKRGDELLILDAMKMQNRLKSAIDGKIRKIHISAGSRVAKGELLLEIEQQHSESTGIDNPGTD